MKAHIDAMRACIPSGYETFWVDVPGTPTYPYVLFWASSGNPGSEVPICGPMDDLEALVGVTVVAANPDAVLYMQGIVRDALSPGGRRTRLDVAGRSASLKLSDSRTVQVDRDVTLPGTNRHPAYGVDMYDLHSTPL